LTVAGHFITLEGGEGVGKSTQARALAETLGARGHDILLTREPGGSDGAEAIRGLLLGGAVDRWSPASEALLFAAARADHVERTIRPALAAGRIVLCDRFVDSTLAYQGAAGGIDGESLRRLHDIGSGGLMPDRTLVLLLSPEEGAARAAERDRDAGDRFARRDAAFHLRVAEAFGALAASEPDRVRAIDASGPVEAVTGRLLAALDGLL
jgi:dTMP kinase